MPDEQRKKYDIDALRARLPQNSSEFFIGFAPWDEDAEGWTRASRESLPESPARPLIRTIFNSPRERDTRILIDVTECRSAEDAIEALVDQLVNNQLAQIPEGPRGLGEASFSHPEGAPPAIFFVRGNLCISVISFGRKPAPVEAWARRISTRLSGRPPAGRSTVSLSADSPTAKSSQPVTLRYSLPEKLGDGGYVKFFVSGATVVRPDETRVLRLTARSPGEALVEAFAVEPGRQANSGRLALRIE